LLPEKIKCGARTIAIAYSNELVKRHDATASYSYLNFGEICIQADLPQERMVWHIWMQLMAFVWASICPEQEGSALLRVGRMLLGIIRDNPLVVDAGASAILKEITICGFEYQVMDMPASWSNNAQYAPSEHLFRVNAVLKAEEKWLSLLHELVHAAYDLAGIEDESEEDVVRLTDKLGDIFTDNDMYWLIERVKNETDTL